MDRYVPLVISGMAMPIEVSRDFRGKARWKLQLHPPAVAGGAVGGRFHQQSLTSGHTDNVAC